MKKMALVLAASALLVAAPGCMDRTVLVDQDNDQEIVAGLDYKDFAEAAETTTRQILTSAKVNRATRGDKTYVVAIGKVIDETPLAIDTDLVTARITEALLNDDRFEISAVFADKADNQDTMVTDVRTVRGNAEFDSSTVQQQGQLKAPDFSLFGKIIARDVKRDNGGHQYEYYFQMKMTDLSTGSLLITKETRIVKRTGKKSHTW